MNSKKVNELAFVKLTNRCKTIFETYLELAKENNIILKFEGKVVQQISGCLVVVSSPSWQKAL